MNKKTEVNKILNTAEEIKFQFKLTMLKSKFAKPFEVVPLAFKAVNLATQYRQSIVQAGVVASQPTPNLLKGHS